MRAANDANDANSIHEDLMPLKQLADAAVEKIARTVSASLSDDERAQVSQIVEQAIIDAVTHVHERYEDVVKVQSGPEADTAHKIAQEMAQARIALVANLSSMR